jgi:hypothetical protein
METRMKKFTVRMITLGAVAVLAAPLMTMQPAAAATAPDLACGNTQPGPCSETAHFTDINDMNSPAPPGGGCPAYLSTDFFTFVGTGHGVEHNSVHNSHARFSMSFTGITTVTAYLHGTINSDGDVTSVSDPDPNVLPFTGRLTQSFGGSLNAKSGVFQFTLTFSGSNANGDHIRVHVVSHQSFTPSSGSNGPPHTAFDKITCS